MIFAQTAAVGDNNVPKYTPRPLNGVAPSQMQRQGEAHGTLLLLFLRYGVPPSTTEILGDFRRQCRETIYRMRQA